MPGKLGRAMLANGLLGYPDDARLLILNADDVGMSASVNEGVLRAAREREGIVLLGYEPLRQVWARH